MKTATMNPTLDPIQHEATREADAHAERRGNWSRRDVMELG